MTEGPTGPWRVIRIGELGIAWSVACDGGGFARKNRSRRVWRDRNEAEAYAERRNRREHAALAQSAASDEEAVLYDLQENDWLDEPIICDD